MEVTTRTIEIGWNEHVCLTEKDRVVHERFDLYVSRKPLNMFLQHDHRVVQVVGLFGML